MNFPLSHIASLLKYTGISFTAGAITHGFFSHERSFWTALTGVCLFILGGIVDKVANPKDDHSWSTVLVIGIVASIGLGFFTGGLQHFPDSPYRSVWVVPVGFVMSLVAVYMMSNKKERTDIKPVIKYGIIGTIIVVLASAAAFEHYHDLDHDDHDHDHGVAEQPAPTQAADKPQPTPNK